MKFSTIAILLIMYTVYTDRAIAGNVSSSHLQSGNNYYCEVTYGGVRLSVTASWDPVGMVITCAQRNVSAL